MPIQFTSPASVAVPEGGHPNLKISAINTVSLNIGVNIELSGDIDLFRHSGLDHFLGDGEASQYFPTGVDYDRPVATVYQLTAFAWSEWEDETGHHYEEATQTFQLNITDLPVPDHSAFESTTNFAINETSGESRIVNSALYELSAFGGTHISPPSETENSGPLEFTLVDNDGGNFESFTGGGYADPDYNPTGFWIRTTAGASIQVGEDGTAQRHIKVLVSDGKNSDLVDMTINVRNVPPTTPTDTDMLGNGTRGGITYQGIVDENATGGTSVGITAHAADPGSAPLTYSIVNASSSPFQVDPQTGEVTVKPGAVFDFETRPQVQVSVQVTDGRPESSTTQTFVVDVRDVNEAPRFHSLLDGLTVELQENSTDVLDLSPYVHDPDTTGDTISYSISGGVDADLFSMSSSGQLAFKTGPDFDQPLPPSGDDPFGINQVTYLGQMLEWARHTAYGYDVQVSASDNSGALSSMPLAVRVTNVNEAPFILTNILTVASGSNAIGRIWAIDPDGDNLVFNFSPGDYESQGRFLLAPNGTVSFWSPKSYDPGNPVNNLYELPVTVSDRENGGGFVISKTITVEVTAPVQPAVVSINDVSVTEGDSGTRTATFTVSRTGGTAAFDVDFATANGTATTADGDYLGAIGTLHFGDHEMTKTISVAVQGDISSEASEFFVVDLSSATNGATIAQGQGVATIINDDFRRESTDIDADGSGDLLWRHADGHVNVWTSSSSGFTGHDQGSVDIGWQVQRTGDFDGDGRSDILWQNSSGAVNVWTATGSGFSGHDIGTIPTDWHITETGDVNGDGRADVVWRNDNGSLNVWTSAGSGFNAHDFGIVDPSWKIQQAADFDGDGKSDLLWRNDNGALNVWTSTATNFSGHDLGTIGNDWKVQEATDFDGDGRADILWRNDNGALNVWTSTGFDFTGHDLGFVGNDWLVESATDTTGDGRADIVWRQDSGSLNVWEATGSSFVGHDHGVVDPSWHIVS